ncbi:MAG: AAA family ATPase [Clostridia bacterium]|nr:AAA family ATPase [Clostridia bacterium]
MNIKEAKQQIKNAITAYFTKNEFGEYVIPIEKQRPIFLLGAPGIGKTAIMEQIASELGVGLVSYSMTHHTRQSALGLPFIVKKNYDGKEYDVSEYTMSEIIASVYDMIENTGHKEGILFLDEINCVSETLAPAMLQFLQYKVFGKHAVPKGWLVVTAGNPPEYNNSVREFDIVTWDRLKKVVVEADYGVWKEYAINSGVHTSITTYLDVKKTDFYKIETTVDGKSFVTARGWCDLSDMIRLYERNNIEVNKTLIEQYLQNAKIAKDFAIYYDLYNKYKSDYQIDEILSGKYSEPLVERAKNAKFDERIALIGLLLDGIYERTKNVYIAELCLKRLTQEIKLLRGSFMKDRCDISSIDQAVKKLEAQLERGKQASSLSKNDIYTINAVIKTLWEIKELIIKNGTKNGDVAFGLIRDYFNNKHADLKELAQRTTEELSNAFRFMEKAFGDGQEMLVFVTELTINDYTTSFISHYGCAEYFKHNKELLLYDRHKEIIREIEIFNIDEGEE